MDGGTIFGVLLIISIVVLLAIAKVGDYMSQLSFKKERDSEEESQPLDCAKREPWEDHGKLINGYCPKCGKSFTGPGRKLSN